MQTEAVWRALPRKIREVLAEKDLHDLQEIRLRSGQPLLLKRENRLFSLGKEGGFLPAADEKGMRISMADLRETVSLLSGYSLYAFEEEIRQGFLTIVGGHRVGIAGKTILDGNKIKSLKYISYINLRLSHQIKGCASPILPYIIKNRQICHTLIISPPRCGKTTLLRDLIRQVSNGNRYMPGVSVGVVDERSEIAGSYQGIPQNDLGIRTDVLDCCPKAEGMMMLIRSMSPEVVAVDELGDYEDIHAIESVIHCGCKLFATVHGSSIEDIKRKPLLQRLMQEKVFERYIVLYKKDCAGQIKAIYDERGTGLYDASRRQGILC